MAHIGRASSGHLLKHTNGHLLLTPCSVVPKSELTAVFANVVLCGFCYATDANKDYKFTSSSLNGTHTVPFFVCQSAGAQCVFRLTLTDGVTVTCFPDPGANPSCSPSAECTFTVDLIMDIVVAVATDDIVSVNGRVPAGSSCCNSAASTDVFDGQSGPYDFGDTISNDLVAADCDGNPIIVSTDGTVVITK